MKWEPQEGPQTEFFKRSEKEVLYGGAAGGGKSDALLMAGLRGIKYPAYRAYFFRRTFPSLQRPIDRAKELFGAYGGQWKEGDKEFIFPSGAVYRMRHMEEAGDWEKYQGHEIHYAAFDELTQFLENQYRKIMLWTRSTIPGLKAFVRSSSNPRGVGHAWVKARFVDNGPYKTVTDTFLDPVSKRKFSTDRVFIPANVYDNKILLDLDPGYLAALLSMPEVDRKAYLEGSWDFYEGQFFSEWRETIHCCEPFPIHTHWKRFACLDYGFVSPFAAYLMLVGPDRKVYVRHEVYKSKLTDVEQAEAIAEAWREFPPEYVVAGRDIWSPSGKGLKGVSTAETYQRVWNQMGFKTNIIMGDNARVMGWRRVREFLKPYAGPDGLATAHLQVVKEECPNLVRTLPSLPHKQLREGDERSMTDDIDDRSEDHAAEAVRLGLMSRPAPRIEMPQAVTDGFDFFWKKLQETRSKVKGIGSELGR